MDDFNMKTISDAKNEYTITLINILIPNIIKGIKSIFKEALELCIQNDEKNKYLMTFQNFLTRVPKWNQSIIDNECNRINNESNCNYLEDLITCVHITQLKILTSIRVSNKQKKINIEIPKFNNFIHRIYINLARKLYSNIFLFDITIPSLEIQKNNRELEIICKECILNTVRNNIPIEKILNAYIDETNEDEVIENVIKDISNNIKENINENNNENNNEKEQKQEIQLHKSIQDKNVIQKNNTIHEIEVKKQVENDKEEENKKHIQNNYEKLENSKLSFNNNDTLIEFNSEDTTDVIISKNEINAPKNIDTLEKISKNNNEKRKLEEQDEYDNDDDYNDKLKINMSSKPFNDIELEIETL